MRAITCIRRCRSRRSASRNMHIRLSKHEYETLVRLVEHCRAGLVAGTVQDQWVEQTVSEWDSARRTFQVPPQAEFAAPDDVTLM